MAAGKQAGMADVAALKTHIRAGKPAQVYLFTGSEDFLIRQYHREMVQFVLPTDTKDFNYVVFDGKQKTSTILDAAETFPVFSERKLLVVKESGFFKPSKNDGGISDADKQAWKAYFENMPDYTVLLFIEPEVNKTLSLTKWVLKYGMAVEFNHPSDDLLIKWLMRLAGERGKHMSQAVAGRLLHLAEEDMLSLSHEMDKLILHAQTHTNIDMTDVDALVIPSIRSRVFDLMDAIADNSKSEALRLLDHMILMREPEHKIFLMIAKQGGRMLQAVRLQKAGMRPDQISERLGLNPWSAKKLLAASAKVDESRLKHFVISCAEMDAANKDGRMKLRTAMEVIIAGF